MGFYAPEDRSLRPGTQPLMTIQLISQEIYVKSQTIMHFFISLLMVTPSGVCSSERRDFIRQGQIEFIGSCDLIYLFHVLRGCHFQNAISFLFFSVFLMFALLFFVFFVFTEFSGVSSFFPFGCTLELNILFRCFSNTFTRSKATRPTWTNCYGYYNCYKNTFYCFLKRFSRRATVSLTVSLNLVSTRQLGSP